MSQSLTIDVGESHDAFDVVARFRKRDRFDPHVRGMGRAIAQPAIDAMRTRVVRSGDQHTVAVVAFQQFRDVATRDVDIHRRDRTAPRMLVFGSPALRAVCSGGGGHQLHEAERAGR